MYRKKTKLSTDQNTYKSNKSCTGKKQNYLQIKTHKNQINHVQEKNKIIYRKKNKNCLQKAESYTVG